MLLWYSVVNEQKMWDDAEMVAGDEPKTRNIAVKAAIHAQFSRVCESRPVRRSMQDVATQLLEWFSRQPPIVQTAIMADVDQGLEHAYATALELLAAELRRPPQPAVSPDDPHDARYVRRGKRRKQRAGMSDGKGGYVEREFD